MDILKIDKSMMVNQEGADTMISEQFMCLICKDMVIPKFSIGANGVNRGSIKLPQCESCDGLACYNCWKDHVQNKKNFNCPGCQAPIETRRAESRQSLKS